MNTVFVSVLPRTLFGEEITTSPKVFATKEAAQRDCDTLNKTRNLRSHFIVLEMEVNS